MLRAAVLRHSPRDAQLVLLAAAYGALLLAVPSAPLIAIGVWWIANTVAHNFIHLPFFRSRLGNGVFSAYLSLLLGVPQTLWRDRHLAHHAGRRWRLRWSPQLVREAVLLVAVVLALAVLNPRFLLATWLAGWSGGMVLCALQGHFEHARGTVSHYSAWYNLAFFNDGFHVEHHARPGLHWSALPAVTVPNASRSRWPAVLRWLELGQLDALERLVFRSGRLQRFVVDRHARAFQKIVAALPPLRTVTIVGGGLFPRTAIVLRRIVPGARLTVIDRSAENLRRARPYFGDGEVSIIEASYAPELCCGADLVVVPLAFDGDRQAIYARPPAPAVAVHDWIWRRRGTGHVVSWLLLKRLNLIRA